MFVPVADYTTHLGVHNILASSICIATVCACNTTTRVVSIICILPSLHTTTLVIGVQYELVVCIL